MRRGGSGERAEKGGEGRRGQEIIKSTISLGNLLIAVKTTQRNKKPFGEKTKESHQFFFFFFVRGTKKKMGIFYFYFSPTLKKWMRYNI